MPPDPARGERSGVAFDAKDTVWLFNRNAPFLQLKASDGGVCPAPEASIPPGLT
jgi:hypothetical protein